jgi:hypothetical protein
MASRLAEILQNEYKTKGVIGGAASALGKRTREKLDIRNALFGGSGLGSIIGRKVFGKGYSATAKDSKISSDSTDLGSGSSTLLQEISINSKVSAKNSLVFPSMARDIFLMKQNMIKMVKLQGGTPTTKAGDWFSRQAAREAAYESKFGKKSSMSPMKIEEKKESGGFFGLLKTLISGISSAITTLGNVISASVTGLGKILASAIDALAIALLGRKILPGVLPGGGAGGKKGKVPVKGGRGRLGGLLSILGLGYVAQDMFGGGSQPESASPGSASPTPGATPEAESKTNWSSVASSSVEAGIGAVGAVSTISGVASRSKVQGYNAKAKQFVDAGGKFVKAKELPKGEMLKKFFDFTAKVASKGWMGKLASKLAMRLGTSIALKAMTFFGGLAVPGAGWFASAIALASLALDAYLIYDAIFAPGGILDELEKEDNSSTKSPTLQTETPSAPPAAPNTPQNSNSPTPSTPSSGSQSNGTVNVGDIGNKKFKDMTLDEQNAFLDRQYAMEGNKKGNLAHDLNNPGAMLYSDWQKKYGAVPNFNRGSVYDKNGKKVAFAQFPDFQSGREAQRALWSSGAYANMSASQAIAKWSGTKEGSAEHQTYLAKTFGTPGSPSSSSSVQLAQNDAGGSGDAAAIMAASAAVNDARNSPVKQQSPVQVAQDNRQTVVNNSGGGGGSQMTAYDQYFGKYLINRTT